MPFFRSRFTNDDDKKMIRYMAAVMHLQKTKPPTSGQQIGATGNRIFQDMCAEVSLGFTIRPPIGGLLTA